MTLGFRQLLNSGRTAGLSGLLLAGLCFGPLMAQDGDVQSLLDEGIARYLEGSYDAALVAFEKAFAQNPSVDAISDFIEKTTYATVYAMVRNSDPRIAGMGRAILDRATRAQREQMEDTEAIRRAVQDVLQADGQEQLFKMIQHTNAYGRNLVPHLIPVLGETDIANQSIAYRWIREIGLSSVQVLVAAWAHPEPRVRSSLARLLGAPALRHTFSLAYLQVMVESDPLSEVKAEARRSIEAIQAGIADRPRGESQAKVYFLANAQMFYLNPHRNPFDNPRYAPVIYTLSGDQVSGEKVARFQLSERLAAQALEEALKLDPEFTEAQVLNLLNDAAQEVNYDRQVAWFEKQDGEDEVKEILARQKPYVDQVLRLRVLAAPREVMYQALEAAIADDRSDVSQRLIEAIHEKELRGAVPEALARALEDGSSRLVRIAAAIAIADWNPLSGFEAGEQVISILSEAVVQSGVRTVVRAMGNQQQANRFNSLFARLNMESRTHVTSVPQAFATLMSLPPDLVLLDEELAFERGDTGKKAVSPINTIVSELRKSYRTVNVPVLVAVEPSRLEKARELYESEERKVRVIPNNIDALTLERGVLSRLFSEKDDAKARATRLSASAARALERLSSVHTRLPVRSSVKDLAKVLSNRPDSVRIPCINALGNLRAGAASVVEELGQVFANGDNSIEVRQAAMLAIGKILAAGSRPASASLLEVIRSGTQEVQQPLRRASWIAFAGAGASAAERLQLFIRPAPGSAGLEPAGLEDGMDDADDDDDSESEDEDDDDADFDVE
jgi:hypothetical protein